MPTQNSLVAALVVSMLVGSVYSSEDILHDPRSLVQTSRDGTKNVVAIQWTDEVTQPYKGIMANAGDKVTFQWTNDTHNVVILDSASCSASVKETLWAVSNSGNLEYVLPPNTNEMTFACTHADHCTSGQIVTFYISWASTMVVPVTTPLLNNPLVAVEADEKQVYVVDWTSHPSSNYEDVFAMCGESVIFNWTGMHDVALATDGDCSQLRSLSTAKNGGFYEYVLPPDQDHLYFASSVEDDCTAGQMIEFYIQCDAGMNATDTAPWALTNVTEAVVSSTGPMDFAG